MKKSLKQMLYLLIVAVSMPMVMHADNSNPTDRLIQRTIPAWMQKNNISGVAITVYTQGVPHTYYFGYANKSLKKPITAHTIFEVGSITKLFTALALAQQIDQGKMQLNDSVSKYLPDLGTKANNSIANITLGQLATHTSGLPTNFPAQFAARANLNKFFLNWHPSKPSGSEWHYSNAGFSLLGYALETATHMSFNQQYRAILQSLGMSPIGITVPQAWQANYAQGYDQHDQPTAKLAVGFYPAAADMKLAASDGTIFLQAALGLSKTPQSMEQAMQRTQTPLISIPQQLQGLGWEIYPNALANKVALLTDPSFLPSDAFFNAFFAATPLTQEQQQFNQDALIEKTGETDGFSAYIGVIPAQKSGVMIFTNHGAVSNQLRQLSRKILLS